MPTRIPASGVKVVNGNGDGGYFCLMPENADATTVGDVPGASSTSSFSTIAGQCCAAGNSPTSCRRQIDGECVAGNSKHVEPRGSIYPATYDHLYGYCAHHNLEICEQSCANTGCGYDLHPVYTSIPCGGGGATPPTPAPIPTPVPAPTPEGGGEGGGGEGGGGNGGGEGGGGEGGGDDGGGEGGAPTPAPTRIPASGVKVVNGNGDGGYFCLMPENADATTVGDVPGASSTSSFSTIAGQCCAAGNSPTSCRRQIDGECVAGNSKHVEPRGSIYPATYDHLYGYCAHHNLEICEQSCANTGCGYDLHPVYTSIPC